MSVQFSPVHGIQSRDFYDYGNPDLILVGNFFGSTIRHVRYDANKGVLLFGDGHRNFEDIPNNKSGLFINEEVKDIAGINLTSGEKVLAFTVNNDSIRFYQKSTNLKVKK